MDSALLEGVLAQDAARRSTIRIVDLDTGAERLVQEGENLSTDPLGPEIDARLRSGKSGRIETGDGRNLFFNVFVPPPRLVLVGAVHISQALAPMAATAGFDVLVIDPRGAFAAPERFEGIPLRADWPQDVFPETGLDRHTAVCALTHDPKIDDPALQAALSADCFYIGALGSRKTHAKRVDRLTAAGFDEPAIARIHAPIGLPIGAATPAEIAVAVLGQIIAARRLRPVEGATVAGTPIPAEVAAL